MVDKYKVPDWDAHIRTKEMWAGSKKIVTAQQLLISQTGDDSIVAREIFPAGYFTKVNYSPILLKTIDEITGNATDQFSEHPTLVTEISTSFNLETGTIKIYNNGTGIPIKKMPNDPHDRYIPEVLFSQYLATSHFTKEDNEITCGTNGLGAKLTNIHSDAFIVETAYNRALYVQKFENNMEKINSPVILPKSKVSDAKLLQPHTSIKFRPSYTGMLNYPLDGVNGERTKTLSQIICARMYYCALYTKYIAECIKKPPPTILYNNNEININAESMLQLINGCQEDYIFKFKAPKTKVSHWEV
jgi:DNA topoisomerase-2